MANELEKAITIKDAIDKIDAGDFLLPSIQRRFVWSTMQIELLFDSIMQDYPINTFMFWEVREDKIKNQFRFYDFLKKYVEYNGGNNEERKTKGYKDFKAIIDGQQRLNSLYIGLKGSFAFRQYIYRKKTYHKDENSYPTRKLYLDIQSPVQDDEEKKIYDFRFLIHNEHIRENESRVKQIKDENKTTKIKCYWFEVGKILEFKSEHDVIKFLLEEKFEIDSFASETLLKLYTLINKKPIINYFLEYEQNFDKILYEFIRTNSGGTKLSFADLLMSIITASWEVGQSTKGAREDIDKIIGEIKEFGFEVDQDFILKTCLVLVSKDIKFALQNFSSDTILEIKKEWGAITDCLKTSFELAKSLSFNNYSLRAKNAIIPIVYFLYITKSYKDFNKETKNIENKAAIKQYLHITLLNKLFGGSSDGFLSKLRNIIFDNQNNIFPVNKFKEEFRGTGKSFNIDEEKLDSFMKEQYESLDSFYILSLLFPKFNFEFKNPNIDHLHPKSHFNTVLYDSLINEQKTEFFKDNYNTISNLALLSEEQNKSKNDRSLKDWIAIQEIHNKNIRNTLLIPEHIDLDISNFEEFISEREKLLKSIIIQNIQ